MSGAGEAVGCGKGNDGWWWCEWLVRYVQTTFQMFYCLILPFIMWNIIFILIMKILRTFTKRAQDHKWVSGSWGLNTFPWPHSQFSFFSLVAITVDTAWHLAASKAGIPQENGIVPMSFVKSEEMCRWWEIWFLCIINLLWPIMTLGHFIQKTFIEQLATQCQAVLDAEAKEAAHQRHFPRTSMKTFSPVSI